MDYAKIIRDVPDFPVKGILFKDLTTLWKDPVALKASIDEIAAEFRGRGITKVVGAESRGFITAVPLAYLLGGGFVPIRKAGKLPAETVKASYALEYGEATIEIHRDALSKDDKVLICDDLLATGGTARAMLDLVRGLGAEVVGLSFLVELDFLKGRERLDADIHTLVHF